VTQALTTEQAAQRLGIEPTTVRRWVMKGWLTPVARSRPLRFHELDVEAARAQRLSEAEHDRLDTLWRGLLDVS
jgi:excisionase family DNA binding protein